MRARLLSATALALSLFFLVPFTAQADLYAPGATLDPSCPPTDNNCGIETVVASSTVNSIPYYAANGSILSATSSLTILQNGNIGIGTTSPFTNLSVAGNGFFNGNVTAANMTATGTLAVSGISTFSNASTSELSVTNQAWFGRTATSTFTSSGFLGIATSSPWGMLSINPNALGSGVPAFVIGSSTATNLVVTRAGEVGIGTASPFDALTVLPTSNTITIASTTSTGLYPYSVYVQGRYAYVVNEVDNTLSILDVSNPSSPVTVSTSPTGQSPYSVYVQGRYAYITNFRGGTLSIIDVSNPASPVTISTYSTVDDLPASVYVQGRYAYVVSEGLDMLSIIDVSNPASPVTISTTLTVGGIPVSVYVQGRYAYVANQGGNFLSIIDVSNPSSPVTVATPSTGSTPSSVYVQGRYAYVANQASNTLSIIDVSNPTSPVTVSTPSTGSEPTSVYVQGRYAYITNELGGGTLSIIDISNPASAVTLSTLSTGSGPFSEPYSVYVQGRYAYVANYGTDSLSIIDLGGAYIQQLETGGLETGTLSVRNNLSAVDGAFTGGLSVGQSLDVTGSGSFVSATSTYNTTANIFNVATASSTDSILSVLGNGDVGIGTTSPSSPLEVWGPNTASTTAFAVANSASTTVFAVHDNGNATYSGSIFQSSDLRLKTDITPLDASSSLAAIEGLTPISYTRIDEPDQGTNLGFTAQAVQQIFPELVSTTSPTALTPDGTLTLNYVGLIAPLVNAVQALATEINGFARQVTTVVLNATDINGTNITASQQLCVGGTCINGSQLQQVLNESRQQGSTPPAENTITTTDVSTSSSATSTDATASSTSDTSDSATSTGETTTDAVSSDQSASTTASTTTQ